MNRGNEKIKNDRDVAPLVHQYMNHVKYLRSFCHVLNVHFLSLLNLIRVNVDL